MQLPKNPIIKDALVTGALALVVLAVVWSAGGAVRDTGPTSSLERQARAEKISLIKKQTILSHTEDTLPSGSVVVRYTYLGEKLPEKLAEDEVPALRTEKSWTRQKGTGANGQAIYEAIMFPSPQYVRYLEQWYRLEYGEAPKETYDAANKGFFSFLPIPVAHAVSVNQFDHTGDGHISSYNASTWAGAHDATSGSSSLGLGTTYTSTNFIIQLIHHTSAGKIDFVPSGYNLTRAFLPFDTSSIPFGATITAASLNTYTATTPTNQDNDGSDYLTVVQTSQASEYELRDEDFDQCGAISSPTEGIDAGQRKDITSITSGSYLTFTLNSTGRGWVKTNGQTSNCGSNTIALINANYTTWRVPNDWSSSNNTIEVIGGGGGGYNGTSSAANSGGAGGGGGGYSKITNVSLPPGSDVTIAIGAYGTGGQQHGAAPTAGGDTYLCNSTSNCASISGTAVLVGAKGGSAASDPGTGTASGGGGAGGSSSSGVGSTKFSGGNGGNRNGMGGAGGGGSGSPNGNGANGGAAGTVSPQSGGGGGGNGGGTGGATTGSTTGGAGGNNSGGAGSGAGGVGGNQSGAGGTAGGGGGGGGSSASIQGGSGGAGGIGTEWDSTHGTSGGGGGGGGTTAASQAGGFGGTSAGAFNGYGGGGGGGGGSSSTSIGGGGGTGGYGAIIITYANATKGTTCLGIREGHDTTNSAISNDTENRVEFAASETSGTSQDPYLAVTYSAPFAFWQFQDY